MLDEIIMERCKKISPDSGGESKCAFAPSEGMSGFIDTSAARDGTRGIAFFGDRMFVNMDGTVQEILYSGIKRINIISSFEDAFADELSVICEGYEVRISDYSLDKFELKRLADELCKEREQTVEWKAERSSIPEGYSPKPITDEKIDWISGANEKADVDKAKPAASKPLAVMSGVIERRAVFDTTDSSKSQVGGQSEKKPPTISSDRNAAELSEREIREEIENMSPEEMMRFLSGTLSEINSDYRAPDSSHDVSSGGSESTEPSIPKTALLKPEPMPENEDEKVSEKPKSKWEKLTAEPIWGDIYIKASKNLRELCESGRLTMEQMEDELKARLLSTAEAFEKIIGSENSVPKVLLPKIEELKSAVENFDQYFDYGEDIAIRAMFFMQYQMLSYADRIEESPETKDRLNDFFKRFGTAGIMLSMLDMRV